MAYITLDFGSSNSGAIINPADDNEYNPSDLVYIHKQDGDASFTKQPSVFWIKRNLLDKSTISEADLNIYSCVFYDEKYMSSANFIWCQNQIKKALPILNNNREWVRIEHPKMALYRSNSNPSTATCTASDRTQVSLAKILNIFFLVIRKECLKKAADAGLMLSTNNINWAITVPGLAIWNQDAVKVIKDIALPIFGDNITFLSEPECALIGINLAGKAELDFVRDRHSLVIDLGGGTADICVMKESHNPDDTNTFDEIKATMADKDPTTSERAGGNDIDRNFISFFCDYLAEGVYSEDSPVMIYKNFRKENPSGAMEFEKKWKELQFSDEIDADIISFSPGRPFTEWLKTHYPASANKRDEYGFSFNGVALRTNVFDPVYNVILTSLEENLATLKRSNIKLDMYYYAGGLSLDKRLKRKIDALVSKYFPYAKKKEASDGAVVGAVQRGGNHILANKERLIRRMARKTFYTRFVMEYPGNMTDLRAELVARLRRDYHERLGLPYMGDQEIKKILDEQWEHVHVEYSDGSVEYLTPLCIKYAPITQTQTFNVHPFHTEQTGIDVNIFSSDKNYKLFVDKDVTDEGFFSHDFGAPWPEAGLIFDPMSNAVSGTALFQLVDKNGVKCEEFVIKNVSKRGY